MTLRCTRAFGVVVGVFFAVGCTPDRPRRTPVDAILSGVECHDGVREALRSLGADETFLPAPPGPNGMRRAWIPTSTFGAWVALTLPEAALEVVMGEGEVEGWDAGQTLQPWGYCVLATNR